MRTEVRETIREEPCCPVRSCSRSPSPASSSSPAPAPAASRCCSRPAAAATRRRPPTAEAPPAADGGGAARDDRGGARRRPRRRRARRRRSRRASPRACTAARSAAPARSATSTRSTPRRAARSPRCARCARTARRPTRSSSRCSNFARPQFEQAFPEGATVSRRALRGGDGDQDRVRRDRARRPSTRTTSATPSTKNGSLRPRHERDRGDGRLRRGRPAPPARRLRREVQAELERPRVGLRRRRADRQPVHEVQGHDLLRSRSTTTRSRTSTAPTCSRARRSRRRSRTSTAVRSSSRSTWERAGDQVAEFFTRPDADVPLYGDVDGRSRRSGARSTGNSGSSAPPTRTCTTSTPTARPTSTTRPASGLRPSILRSLQWPEPGACSRGLDRAVPAHGRRQRLHGRLVPERDEARPGNPDLDTAGVGQYLKYRRHSPAGSSTASSSAGR